MNFVTIRVTSPWVSDDETKPEKEKREDLSEGEWSDLNGKPDREYEEGELREDERSTDNLSLCKSDEIADYAGPALPPGYKLQSKRRHSTKSKRKKKSRDSKRSHKKKPPEKRVDSPKKEKTDTPVQQENDVEKPESTVERPSPTAKTSPQHTPNVDITRSKWDSTEDEEDEMEKEKEKTVVSDNDEGACTELPEAPDSLIPRIQENTPNIAGQEERPSTEWKHTLEKQNKSKSGGQAGKKRKTTEENEPKQNPTKKNKAGGTDKRKLDKTTKGSSARLFEQARNVLLKAEAELAAIGYPGATSALKRGLERSRSYSSSRSRSRSSDRVRRRKYSRHGRGSTRSHSRSSRRRRRRSYSPNSSSYSSSPTRYSSRRSPRYSSRYRRHSHSSYYSKSSRSYSRSSSRSRSTSSSGKRRSYSNRNNTVSSKSDEKSNSPGNRSHSPMVNISKKAPKEKNLKNSAQEEIDPYSEKSRIRNKMGKASKQRNNKETTSAVVTAASVRKAEKTKKLEKLKAEKLVWQPPMEFGEEEESSEEIPKNKSIPQKREEKKKMNGGEMKDDEIEQMLSSGIEASSTPSQAKSGNIFKKRAKMLLEFKKLRQSSQDNPQSETAPTPPKSGTSGAVQDVIVGFGKMPKITPKAKTFKVSKSPKPEIESKKVKKEKIEAPQRVDVDSIWPEDKPNVKLAGTKVALAENPTKKSSQCPAEKMTVKTEQEEIAVRRDYVTQNRSNDVKVPEPIKIKLGPENAVKKPFRVKQYNLAREESDSSESEEEWAPTKLQPAKKTITFNIKLPQPAVMEDKNNNETEKVNEQSGMKKKHKRKKKKKDHKKTEDSIMSLEVIAKTLRRHRQQQKEEEVVNKLIKPEEKKELSAAATSQIMTTSAQSTVGLTKTVNSSPASQHAAMLVTTGMPRRPVPHPGQYHIRGPMRIPPVRGPRGYPYPPYPYQNMQMIRHMGMRYPMPHPMIPMLPNMPPMPVNQEPPPLPKENFPSQPPEPKEKKKLTDENVTDLFKKKIISTERLTSLLEENEEDKEVKIPSPAHSHGRHTRRKQQRQRSYRRKRYSSSDSDSSHSSRSRSRGRSRRSQSSESSYSDRSKSRSSGSSDDSSDSDHSRSPHECRHSHKSYRSRSASSRSYDSSSRSRSRSKSRGRKHRRRTRSRSYSYSDYSSRSRSRSRSYSRKRSRSRRRSYDSDYAYSSG